MKKLGKKFSTLKETIESYACSGCQCYCICNGVGNYTTGTPGTQRYSNHYSPWYGEHYMVNSK